jgi:hypothetical protein
MSFEDQQRRYYLSSLNRAIPVATSGTGAALSSPAANATIQAALGMATSNRASYDVGNFVDVFNTNMDVMKRDAECRALPFPGPGMRPTDHAERVGCGWWYVQDPTATSVGALGTRRGPMSPQLDLYGSGRWMWDQEEAYQVESMKRATSIKACPDVQYSAYDNVGWCPTTNAAIMTRSATDGTPLFAANGGDCPDTVILKNQIQANPAVCNAAGGSSAAAAAGGGGVTGVCSGGTTPACLQSLISTNVTKCNTYGGLYQALSSGYPSQNADFQSVYRFLPQGTLSGSVLAGGSGGSTTNAIQSINNLASVAASNQGTRVGSAAQNLCYGAPFDPCALAPTDTGPYDPSCIVKAALAQGFSAQGGLVTGLQSGAATTMDFWNGLPQWQNVLGDLAIIKQQADNPQSNPSVQAKAIQNVYGLSVKYPKEGCNNYGVLMYRYFFPTWDQTLFPNAGPQTHFLGRYILKNGFPNANGSYADQTPGGGYLTEGQRMVTNFIPQQGGSYIFIVVHDDAVRMQIYDVDGDDWTTITPGSNGWAPCCGPTNMYPITLVAGQVYRIVIDFWNGGGPWSFTLAAYINGSNTATPLPLTQLSMTADRRLPYWELAFNKMGSSSTTAPTAIVDTNGLFQNMQRAAAIGSLNGRQCMIVGGPGQCVFNYNTFVQGVRLRALRSFTMMMQINSIVPNAAQTAPSLVSFFNLPESVVTGYPRKGTLLGSTVVQPYANRVNDFMITATSTGSLYPWGLGPADAGKVSNIQNYFYQNAWVSGEGLSQYPLAQWFHLAWVWDDDFTGYTVYVNGKQSARAFVPAYDMTLIMEQFRIGCDNHPEGQSWTGGIAWFRAFDYRLSQDLIQRDMNDDWASLV